MAISATMGQTATVKTGRVVSLDVLRGATIAFMILVNSSQPHSYAPLHHSDWNGWTPTDLVFPTFMVVMGASIVYSFESRLARGVSRASLASHTFKRFVILFLLGLLVNGFPFFHWETLRIYGVLQRIAICFLLASLLYLWDRSASSKIYWVVALLLGYWVLLRWVPVPGYGLPGRDIPLWDKQANLGAFLDRHIFPGRLYEGVRDPEGLLGDLPSLASTLLGMLAGMWMRGSRSQWTKCIGLAAAGVVLIFLGQIWGIWFPINKNLWTSSFVLFTTGVALISWAVLSWAAEVRGWKRGWTYFWLVFGANAITAYVFSELLIAAFWTIRVANQSLTVVTTQRLFGAFPSAALADLGYSILIVLICWAPVFVLYRKRIFIKV